MNTLPSIGENRDPGPEDAATGAKHTDESGNNERAWRLLPVAAFVYSSPLPSGQPYPTRDVLSAIG